jgi:hypothetical protein
MEKETLPREGFADGGSPKPSIAPSIEHKRNCSSILESLGELEAAMARYLKAREARIRSEMAV